MAIRNLRHTLGAGVLATGLLAAHVHAEPPAHAEGKGHHAEGKRGGPAAKKQARDQPAKNRGKVEQARAGRAAQPADESESAPAYAMEEAKRAAADAQRAVTAAARAARLEANASLVETKKAINEAAKAAREAGKEAFLASKRVAEDARRAAQAAGQKAAAKAKAAGESADEQSEAAEDAVKDAMAAAEEKLKEARRELREQLRAVRWDALKVRLSGKEVQPTPSAPSEPVEAEAMPDVPPAVTQELRRHAKFMARLERARELAAEDKDKKSLKRVDKLTEKEVARHTRKLSQAMDTGSADKAEQDEEEAP